MSEKVNLTREYIIQRLQELPDEINHEEELLVADQVRLLDAKRELKNKEAKLIIEGEITGKNAEQREANLYQLTQWEHSVVQGREEDVLFRKMNVNHKRDEFSAIKAIARLLERGNE